MKNDDFELLGQHQIHLDEHLKKAQATGQPLIVTHNGQPAAVLLSPLAYAQLVAKAEGAENLRVVDRGLADIDSGNTAEAGQALNEIAQRFDLNLET